MKGAYEIEVLAESNSRVRTEDHEDKETSKATTLDATTKK